MNKKTKRLNAIGENSKNVPENLNFKNNEKKETKFDTI